MTKQEAIEILNKNAPKSDPRLCALELCSAIHVVTLALQEPERKKGQWKLIEEDWNVYRCSVCGEDWVLETSTPEENNMNFCPFCGADMRGDEE